MTLLSLSLYGVLIYDRIKLNSSKIEGVCKMKKLDDYNKIIHLIDDIKVDKVYPLSIVEGSQQGEIWVDDLSVPKFALFWHYCGFAYIAGVYDDSLIEEIKEMMHNPKEGHSGRLALQTSVDEKLESIMLQDKTIQKKEQYLFDYLGTYEKKPGELAPGFEILPIDRQNYELLKGHVVPGYSWENKEEFLKNGFGYCIVNNTQFVACAFSAGISKEYVDIGVECSEKYRGKGFAKLVTGATIEETLKRHKVPVWECNTTNEGSLNLACSVGFKIKGIHPLFTL